MKKETLREGLNKAFTPVANGKLHIQRGYFNQYSREVKDVCNECGFLDRIKRHYSFK